MKKLNQYSHYLVVLSLSGLLLSSCTLPKELSGTDSVTVAPSYAYVPDSLQHAQELPAWRNFFSDPLLVQLIDTAIRNNLDLKMANQRIYQAQAGFTFSKSVFFPSINARGAAGTTRFGDYTVDGVGNFDTNFSPNLTEDQRIPNPVPDYFLGLETNWEIGLAGKLRNRKKAAMSRLLASQFNRHYVQTQLVAGTARLYYELLAVDSEIKIIRQNLDLQQRALEIVDIQKQSGQINELAVKQFQVQMLQTKALEEERLQYRIGVENSLNTLLGRYPQPIFRSDTLITSNQLSVVASDLPASLLQNRPDIREAELNLKASEAQLQAVRASFFPVLNISAFVALNGFQPTYFFNPASLAYTVAGSLTAPLINRNQIMNEYRMQASEKKQAFYHYQNSVLTGVSEVSSFYNRMMGYQRISELKQQEVVELKTATTIANDLFLTGYANYLEVLMVRRSVLDSEIELTEAQKEFFHAYIDFYKAMGGGWR
jgi:outer membrane protein, multidrug efflux system